MTLDDYPTRRELERMDRDEEKCRERGLERREREKEDGNEDE